MSPWHIRLTFRSPKALPGRSLAELGFLVPSKLPQGSSEPRDSAPSERGPPAWVAPGQLHSLSKPQTPHFATSKHVGRVTTRRGRRSPGKLRSIQSLSPEAAVREELTRALRTPEVGCPSIQRAAQRTGRQPCWSPRLEGARGSGTFKGCQCLVEGIPRLQPVPGRAHLMHFTMQNEVFLALLFRPKNHLITHSFPMNLCSNSFQSIASIIVS